MILTVTPNVALDVTYRLRRLRVGASNRVCAVHERAGGKGINVARVLWQLGHPCTVTGLVGGATGGAVREDLAVSGLVDALVEVAGDTRRTVAVVDEAAADATMLLEPGPEVRSGEWEALVERCGLLLREASAMVLSGSLPKGAPEDGFAELVRLSRSLRVPVVLDTSGEPLRLALGAGPDVVKPNAHELAELAELAERSGAPEPEPDVRILLEAGALAAVVSLGDRGLVAEAPEGSWSAYPPERMTGNPTGAGDSVAAALASGLVEGLSWPDRLARGVALGAASVVEPLAGSFDEATYRDVLARVVVHRLGA